MEGDWFCVWDEGRVGGEGEERGGDVNGEGDVFGLDGLVGLDVRVGCGFLFLGGGGGEEGPFDGGEHGDGLAVRGLLGEMSVGGGERWWLLCRINMSC